MVAVVTMITMILMTEYGRHAAAAADDDDCNAAADAVDNDCRVRKKSHVWTFPDSLMTVGTPPYLPVCLCSNLFLG